MVVIPFAISLVFLALFLAMTLLIIAALYIGPVVIALVLIGAVTWPFNHQRGDEIMRSPVTVTSAAWKLATH